MDAESRKLLIEIHGNMSGIKPVLEALSAGQKSLDERQRRSEVTSAEHGVKIGRIQSDLDGLGRKVRAQGERNIAEPGSAHSESKWIAFLELLAVLPKYWHVVIGVGGLVTAAASLILRAHGHGQ